MRRWLLWWRSFFLYLPCVSEECHIVVAVDQTSVIDSTMDGHWFIHCMLVAVQVLHRCSMQKSFAPLWSTQGLAHLHTCVKYTMHCCHYIIISTVSCLHRHLLLLHYRQISAVLLLLSMLQCPRLRLYCFHAYCSFL